MQNTSRSQIVSRHVPEARWLVEAWSPIPETPSMGLGWSLNDREEWNVGSFHSDAEVRAAVIGLETASVPADEALAAAGFALKDVGGGFSVGDKNWLRHEKDGCKTLLVMAFNQTRIEQWRDGKQHRLASISAILSMPQAMLGCKEPGATAVAALLAVLAVRMTTLTEA